MTVYVLVRPKTAESSANLLTARFFDPRRYDLAAVGRPEINKNSKNRQKLVYYTKQSLRTYLVNPETGEARC